MLCYQVLVDLGGEDISKGWTQWCVLYIIVYILNIILLLLAISGGLYYCAYVLYIFIYIYMYHIITVDCL